MKIYGVGFKPISFSSNFKPQQTSFSGIQRLDSFVAQEQDKEINDYHRAAINGDIEAVKKYLKNGGDINAKNLRGNDALILALAKGRIKMADFLIENGISLDTEDKVGYTAITVANPLFNITRDKLLRLGAKLGRLDRTFNCIWGFEPPDILEIYLAHGTDIDEKDILNFTLLQKCVIQGKLENVEFCLKKNADPNTTTEHLSTPLSDACEQSSRLNDKREAKSLISLDKDPNIEKEKRFSNEHSQYAFKIRREFIQKLKADGVDFDKVNENGKTEVEEALYKRRIKIVELLLNAGAKVDTEDSEGKTALYYAKLNKDFEIVALLLAAGAKDVKISAKEYQDHLKQMQDGES